MSIKLQTDKRLEMMAITFRQRNSMYKDNYNNLGAVMTALFPDGIILKDEHDFIIYHWLDWSVGKLTRFVNSGMKDEDSIHDCAVYMAMIADYITQLREIPHPLSGDEK